MLSSVMMNICYWQFWKHMVCYVLYTLSTFSWLPIGLVIEIQKENEKKIGEKHAVEMSISTDDSSNDYVLIFHSGLPSFVNVVPHLGSVPVGKKREDVRKHVQSLVAEVYVLSLTFCYSLGKIAKLLFFFSIFSSLNTNKLFCCDTEAERILLLRHFVDMKKNKMLLQKRRPHILVEKLDVVSDNVC